MAPTKTISFIYLTNIIYFLVILKNSTNFVKCLTREENQRAKYIRALSHLKYNSSGAESGFKPSFRFISPEGYENPYPPQNTLLPPQLQQNPTFGHHDNGAHLYNNGANFPNNGAQFQNNGLNYHPNTPHPPIGPSGPHFHAGNIPPYYSLNGANLQNNGLNYQNNHPGHNINSLEHLGQNGANSAHNGANLGNIGPNYPPNYEPRGFEYPFLPPYYPPYNYPTSPRPYPSTSLSPYGPYPYYPTNSPAPPVPVSQFSGFDVGTLPKQVRVPGVIKIELSGKDALITCEFPKYLILAQGIYWHHKYNDPFGTYYDTQNTFGFDSHITVQSINQWKSVLTINSFTIDDFGTYRCLSTAVLPAEQNPTNQVTRSSRDEIVFTTPPALIGLSETPPLHEFQSGETQISQSGESVTQVSQSGASEKNFDKSGASKSIFDQSGGAINIFDQSGASKNLFDQSEVRKNIFDQSEASKNYYDQSGASKSYFDQSGASMGDFSQSEESNTIASQLGGGATNFDQSGGGATNFGQSETSTQGTEFYVAKKGRVSSYAKNSRKMKFPMNRNNNGERVRRRARRSEYDIFKVQKRRIFEEEPNNSNVESNRVKYNRLTNPYAQNNEFEKYEYRERENRNLGYYEYPLTTVVPNNSGYGLKVPYYKPSYTYYTVYQEIKFEPEGVVSRTPYSTTPSLFG